MRNDLTFRQYMELEKASGGFLDKLSDELGIRPDTLDDAPQWLANFTLGKYTYNGSTFQIVELVRENGKILGAKIKLLHPDRAYMQDSKKRMIRSPSDPDDDTVHFVPLADLESMLTQGLDQPPGGSGMMGLM